MPSTISKYLNALSYLAAGGFSFFIFAWIQFGAADFAGTDAYYHTKIAKLLSETAPWKWPIAFPWLPETVLDESHYVDHHFLFHVFLAPFVAAGLPTGGKWGAVTFAVLAAIAFNAALPRRAFALRLYFTLAYFAVSSGFLYRMSMVRAQSLSLAILFLLFAALVRGRLWSAAALSFAYVWLYNGFPLAGVLLFCFFAASFAVNRTYQVKAVGLVVLGLVAGVVINPYFPANVEFLYHHLIDKFTLSGYAVIVGNEWYAYGARTFLANAGVSVCCLLVTCWLASRKQFSFPIEAVTAILFSAALLVLLLKSRRFIELFPAISLLALAWTVAGGETSSDGSTQRWALRPIIFGAALVGLAGILAFYSAQSAREQVDRGAPYKKYQDSAEWLKDNTEEGSLVFTADWDDFPRIFHFNHHNRYLVGLDPYFLYARNPRLFYLWRTITRGKYKGRLSFIIKKEFGTRYIYVDNKHRRFRRQLRKDPLIKLAFKGAESYVFVIEDKGGFEDMAEGSVPKATR